MKALPVPLLLIDNGDWVRDYLTLTVKDGKYVLYEE